MAFLIKFQRKLSESQKKLGVLIIICKSKSNFLNHFCVLHSCGWGLRFGMLSISQIKIPRKSERGQKEGPNQKALIFYFVVDFVDSEIRRISWELLNLIHVYICKTLISQIESSCSFFRFTYETTNRIISWSAIGLSSSLKNIKCL